MHSYEYPIHLRQSNSNPVDVTAPAHAPASRRQLGQPLPLPLQQEESRISILLLFGLFVIAIALFIGYLAKDYNDAVEIGTIPIICTPGFLPNLQLCNNLRTQHGINENMGGETNMKSEYHSFRGYRMLLKGFKSRQVRMERNTFKT